MISWETLTANPGAREKQPTVLTIGVFDGVHIGHQKLISAIVHNPYRALPVVCSFRQNPRAVLGTKPVPGSILSLNQKMRKFESLGIPCVVLIDFSPEISKLTGKDFLEVLERDFEIKKIVVGYNFHMGKGRETGVRELSRLLANTNTELEVVPAAFYQDKVVSSSRIREAIRDGSFLEAREMLQGDYCLDLEATMIVREGERALVKRSALSQILPHQGVFRACIRAASGELPAEVAIDRDTVSWETDERVQEKEICFTER